MLRVTTLRRFVCLFMLCLAISSCQVDGIPFKDQNGDTIRNIWLYKQGATLEIQLSTLPEAAQPEAAQTEAAQPEAAQTEATQVLSISMARPHAELSLELLSQDDEIIETKTISPYLGLGAVPGQGILDFQFERNPAAHRLRLRSEAPEEPPEIYSLTALNDYSGLIVEDYHLVLPESMRYRQEIRSPAPDSGGAPVIYQEIYFNDLLGNFNSDQYIPIFELAYVYERPDTGMPIDADHFHFDEGDAVEADPAPPVAKVELFSENFDLLEAWELRLRPGNNAVYIYPETIVGNPANIRFVHNSVHGQLRGFRLIHRERSPSTPSSSPSTARLEPLPIDLGVLMDYSSLLWRQEEFELFSWSLFPEVLIFDFANYAVQARFFKRLAHFVEKDGSRGTILTNDALQNLHGWNAHNYHPRDLAIFYNRASAESLELNPEELLLREILLERGVLSINGTSLEEGEGQIISITSHPGQAGSARRLFLNHEALHGIFYNYPPLRESSTHLWTTMNSDSREYITQYLSYVGYDRDDEYLMLNEFQAYMLQQELRELPWVVENRMAERLIRWSPSLRGFVNRVKAQARNDLFHAAHVLQSLVYQNLGVVAGDLFDLIEEN